jgi:hypothetical protein
VMSFQKFATTVISSRTYIRHNWDEFAYVNSRQMRHFKISSRPHNEFAKGRNVFDE